MPDGRKNNGGKSTKSKKPIDRRKRMSFENPEQFEFFFEQIKVQMYHFYESVRKDFLDKHIRHGNYYVYLHKLEGAVVYVGKGKGDRKTSHLREAKKGERSDLYDEIRRLDFERGVEIREIAGSLTEHEALSLEAELIETIGRVCINTGPLLNKTSGGEGISGEIDKFGWI